MRRTGHFVGVGCRENDSCRVMRLEPSRCMRPCRRKGRCSWLGRMGTATHSGASSMTGVSGSASACQVP